MGHKAIVIVDMDHLDMMTNHPLAFVDNLREKIAAHKRLGGGVRVCGATVANVVWSGNVKETPTLTFKDYGAERFDE